MSRKKTRGQKRGTIELGIREERVSAGAHIAFLWETKEEFDEAIGFLEQALHGPEHAVIFGHPEANDRVAGILTARGHDLRKLERDGKLSILPGLPKGDAMLESIGGVFKGAVDGGATLIRLLGNIGWSHDAWPPEREVLAFEARVTEAAKQFPCVVMCMYDVHSLSGRALVSGGYETHPLIFRRNVLRENPHYVPITEFLADVEP